MTKRRDLYILVIGRLRGPKLMWLVLQNYSEGLRWKAFPVEDDKGIIYLVVHWDVICPAALFSRSYEYKLQNYISFHSSFQSRGLSRSYNKGAFRGKSKALAWLTNLCRAQPPSTCNQYSQQGNFPCIYAQFSCSFRWNPGPNRPWNRPLSLLETKSLQRFLISFRYWNIEGLAAVSR